MDVQNIAAIVFLVLLAAFLIWKRKRVDLQKLFFPLLYVVMYRTTLGLKQMDSWAKRFPRVVQWFGTVSVFIGFAGMAVIAFTLIKGLYTVLLGTAAPAVSLVLPFKAKGTFYVPFFYWILTIFIIAVVHEFCHGLLARRHGIPVKSSGFAFLSVLIPVLPAAFVEPEEKNLEKKPKMAQLAVFAAGPVSNLVTAGLVILLVLVVLNPLSSLLYTPTGVQITGLANMTDGGKYPAEIAGVLPGDRIVGIGDGPIHTVADFTTLLKAKKPGDTISITTNRTMYTLALAANPDDAAKPYLGVFVQQDTERNAAVVAQYGRWPFPVFDAISGFCFWLYALSLGIGLFNLLPLGPIDGGRMLKTALRAFFSEAKANLLWKWTGLFFLAVILLNLSLGFFR